MKKVILPLSTLGLVGAVSLGVLGLNAAAADEGNDAYVKREDKANTLALADDDVDDDTDSGGDSGSGSGVSGATGGTNGATGGTNDDTSNTANTGSSRSRADGTNSRYSGVSRDQDRSRGDRTKDWTQDGPGSRTRDISHNMTNDKSRHDTR